MPSSPQVSQLLSDWRNGDQQALGKLVPLVYDELRRIASGYMKRERAATLFKRLPSSTRHICDWWIKRLFGGRTARIFLRSPLR